MASLSSMYSTRSGRAVAMVASPSKISRLTKRLSNLSSGEKRIRPAIVWPVDRKV